MNLLLTFFLTYTPFTTSKTRFLVFSIDFWTRNLANLEAISSGIALQFCNIFVTTFSAVTHLLLTVLLNKTQFTASKTRLLVSIEFCTRNVAYLYATNWRILLQHSNVLKTTFCIVMNWLLSFFSTYTLFTGSKTRFLVCSIDFWARNLAYLLASNSRILLQHSNILKTTFCIVMNLWLTVLLNETWFTECQTRFLCLRSIFVLET